MTTKRVETKVYTEHMYCECGGEITREESMTVLCTYPATYHHRCNKCGKIVGLNEVYPRIVYEEVETTEINTAFGEWIPCRNCTYFEDCEDKESREGCYCGEKRGCRNEY